MKYCILIIWILIALGTDAGYAQFNQNASRSLFSDVKAAREGDAIMVLIMEDTQADNSAQTSDSRSTALSGGVNAGYGSKAFNADAGINTSNDFKGSGNTTRKETIQSRLSAKIVKIETNGNMQIEGTRTTKVNNETQTITIKGIVRQVDVMADNSIYSYNIQDLTLTIEGDGSVSRIQEPGLITKFLRILF